MRELTESSSLEWLNSNMHRNYPIIDNTVPKDLTDRYYLPSSFLVDLQLIVPYVEGIDASRFFISSISKTVDSYQVTIGYLISAPTDAVRYGFDCAIATAIPADLLFTGDAMDAEHTFRISAITTAATHTTSTYTYGIPDDYGALRGIRGSLYVGTCSDLSSMGALSFDYASTAIMPTCVYVEDPITEVSSIRFTDSTGTDATLTDDITIVLSEGITAEISDDNSSVTLKLDPVYLSSRINAILADKVANSIKTINGIGPDDRGNFQIVGKDCTAITTESSGISISNPCSKPCCDSTGTESEAILKALTDLTSAKGVLNDYYTSLATNVNMLQARLSALIASRR